MRVLIVEDEAALAMGLKFNFEQEGYEVTAANDGVRALSCFQEAEHPFDLVILDLMLPGKSGYEICQEIRRSDPTVPILVLSARSLSEDKARAFDCGTDQYMTKPFALPELLSRARNLIRRHSGRVTNGLADVVRFGDVTVDVDRFQLTKQGKTTDLTTTELELLKYFLKHENRVLSRAQILEDVWGQRAEITTRTIDNFVMRLRRLIEDDASDPKHLISVRGTGYRFISGPDFDG